MYHYQFIRKNRGKNYGIIATLCITAVLLFFVEYSGHGKAFRREAMRMLCQDAVAYCLPFFTYMDEPIKEKSIDEVLLCYVFPFLRQKQEVAAYQTQVESELSYEMILAMEAAAESYIDEETGELVGDAGIEELVPELFAEKENGQEDDGQAVQAVITGSLKGRTEKAVEYSREKLADFDYLIKNFYRVDKTTTITGEQLNASEMLAKNMTLTHDADSPQILIYHTHSQEGYADSVPGDATTTVVGVGDYLTQILEEEYGLNVIHHKGEYDVVTRDNAYSLAGPALEQILTENPSIEVVIDLHRDGVGEETRLVTNIDGVDMAKIMFVNGLSRTTSAGNISYLYNPNLADNLAFSFQTQLTVSEYYPGLSRGIYLKGYRFNLHYCPKSLLVEVGAQTNTLQEAMNAMVPLADVLHKVVTGENKD